MQINVIYDPSVQNAPAGFQQVISDVVNFYDTTFINPVTITVEIGYGEVADQGMWPGALGQNIPTMIPVSYADLQSALVANALAIGNTAAAASLSAVSPVNGQFWVTTAEAKALGIAIPDGTSTIDGYIGFSSIPTLFNYGITSNSSSGSVPNYQYDFFGVVAHEFSEIMGRNLLAGASYQGAPAYEALDLFHYSAPGVADFSGTTPGYFSANGGVTNLDSFNTNPNGDFGDWAGSAGNDAFVEYISPGVVNVVTPTDITLMNLLGWDTAPTVTASSVCAHTVSSGTVAVPSAQAAQSGVLAGDTDSRPGAVLSVSAVDGSTANVGHAVAGEFGSLTLNADGSYSYINTNPAAVNALGGVVEDVFNFTVSDGDGGSATSTLTVFVTSANATYVSGAQGSMIQTSAHGAPAVLDGTAGHMTLVAAPGAHQTLLAGPNDTLIGAAGKDTFVFPPNFGNETIQNFHGRDVIELPSSEFSSFADVKAAMTTQGHDTVIALDSHDTITITNTTAHHLHAYNFDFV